ncbi:hypothetical protein BM1_04804 [Bipolaris maydis]|nr:hypothetical protein BM1_04804 [Bipolaris maydis]
MNRTTVARRGAKAFAIPSEVEAALYPPRIRLNNALRQYAFRARKLAPSHPLNIAINSNQGKQLERLIYLRNQRKAKQSTTRELLEDEHLLSIYSDASATSKGKGVGVGVALYKGASLIAQEKANIGYNQLVYNGELEGITLGLEKAVDLADDYLEVRIYADNQAAILRLKTASDYPGQEWQLRCTIAAEKLQEKGILPTIQWVPGHQGVIGNERADALAKEATKLDPSSSRTSLAVIGTRIKQLGEREWLSYLGQYGRKAITLNPTTYAARYKWKTRKQIATPPTSREASSAFYQLKLDTTCLMAEPVPKNPSYEVEKPKFSQFLTSSVVTVTVAKSRAFYLHFDLLIAESERFSNSLTGKFKEAEEKAIELVDEDPELFGFFIKYLYHNRSLLSREIQHYSEYVTLARLYAIGERLMAPKFKAYSFWRFVQSLSSDTFISDESVCKLLRIACTEIAERAREDPMRAYIFWYAGAKISKLQKSGMFRQLLCDNPDLGRYLCLWIGESKPAKADMPNELRYQKFAPESEYPMQGASKAAPKAE